MKRIVLHTVLLFVLAATAGAQQLTVVSTIHPYYDLVRQIGGEHVVSDRLLPIGASPHSFEPSPRDVIRIANADLVIHNGGTGLDEWVLRLIDTSGTQATRLSIMDSISFNPLGASHHRHGSEEDHAHDEAYINPHIWLDVTIAMSAVQVIADALVELAPQHADEFTANAEALLTELAALDAQLIELLAPISGEPFVPFHDAWPYFAQRYNLNLLVEIEPFPGREPSPEYLLYALGEIAGSNAKAIFGERQLSPRPAEVVADEAGLPLYVLDPEGGGNADVETYQELLRFNARVLLEALGD